MTLEACCSYCVRLGFTGCCHLAGCFQRPGGPITNADPRFDAECSEMRLYAEALYPRTGYHSDMRAISERLTRSEKDSQK